MSKKSIIVLIYHCYTNFQKGYASMFQHKATYYDNSIRHTKKMVIRLEMSPTDKLIYA
jgi:hypothetical protein